MSPTVKQHLFSKGISPDTMFLNDEKFLAKALHILMSIFGYKPSLTQHQFFNYGYAAPKMQLCLDVINLVKRTRRDIQKKADLKKKRPVTTRDTNEGTFAIHDHSANKTKEFSYSRQEVQKRATVHDVTYSGEKTSNPFTRETI
jgi:hypothetical protein